MYLIATSNRLNTQQKPQIQMTKLPRVPSITQFSEINLVTVLMRKEIIRLEVLQQFDLSLVMLQATHPTPGGI